MAIFYDEEDFIEEVDDLENEAIYDVRIKVFGIGGGGCNALEHMAKTGIRGVEYIAVNTDVPALRGKDKTLMTRLQIGKKTTKGRGAGGNPDVAKESANENREEIQNTLRDSTMVFILAGMGGGTGTGASPVIAEIAKEMGILTVGIVTKPFDFEREQKMNQALRGISEMRKYVDALVIIPNQRLLKINERAINFKDAFAMVDNVLYTVVRSISELLNKSAEINIDFADLKSTLQDAGDAHIAIGVGSGENKVDDAIDQIVNSPLLETSIANSGKILVNISLSEDVLLSEVDDVMQKITGVAQRGVKVINGADFAKDTKDKIVVTVIATRFNEDKDSDITIADINENTKATDENFIETTVNNALDQLITQNLGDEFEEDPFKDLNEIFKKR